MKVLHQTNILLIYSFLEFVLKVLIQEKVTGFIH